MYKLMTGTQEQRFASKKQAVDFYTRGVKECSGAERERYTTYLIAMALSKNPNEATHSFSGTVESVFEYDPAGDYLRELQE